MKIKILLFIAISAGLLLSGCGPRNDPGTARLGEEISLSRGQSVLIRQENLEITFMDVLEDSRCPEDVECVWAGVARSQVQFHSGGTTENLELSEPGLADHRYWQTYLEYQVAFTLTPYPESGTESDPADYRLLLTVTSLK